MIDSFVSGAMETLSLRPESIDEIGEANTKHSQLQTQKPEVHHHQHLIQLTVGWEMFSFTKTRIMRLELNMSHVAAYSSQRHSAVLICDGNVVFVCKCCTDVVVQILPQFQQAEEKNRLLRSVAGGGLDTISSLRAKWDKFELVMESHQLMIKEQVQTHTSYTHTHTHYCFVYFSILTGRILQSYLPFFF